MIGRVTINKTVDKRKTLEDLGFTVKTSYDMQTRVLRVEALRKCDNTCYKADYRDIDSSKEIQRRVNSFADDVLKLTGLDVNNKYVGS